MKTVFELIRIYTNSKTRYPLRKSQINTMGLFSTLAKAKTQMIQDAEGYYESEQELHLPLGLQRRLLLGLLLRRGRHPLPPRIAEGVPPHQAGAESVAGETESEIRGNATALWSKLNSFASVPSARYKDKTLLMMNEKENEQNRITEAELVETLQNLNQYREKIAQMKPEDFKPTGEYFQIEGTTFQLKMSPEATRGDLLYLLSYIRDLVKRKLRTLSSKEEDKPKEKKQQSYG